MKNVERVNVNNKYPIGDQKNQGKRIVIRKIAREVGIEYVYDEEGQPIRFEEWEYQNKYINYREYDWPKGMKPIEF